MVPNQTQIHTWKYRLHSQWSRSEEIRASIFLNWSSCVFGTPLTSGALNLRERHNQIDTANKHRRISFFFLNIWAPQSTNSMKSNSDVALIRHWPTCRGWDRGLVRTLEMPPKPALSWHGCWVLVDLLVGMSGSWRGGPRRLLVGSGETWETPHSPTMQVETHACRRTDTHTHTQTNVCTHMQMRGHSTDSLATTNPMTNRHAEGNKQDRSPRGAT